VDAGQGEGEIKGCFLFTTEARRSTEAGGDGFLVLVFVFNREWTRMNANEGTEFFFTTEAGARRPEETGFWLSGPALRSNYSVTTP